MKAGDFSTLAVDYAQHRPGYSDAVLQALVCYTGALRPGFTAVDVGAGTGIWTKMLADYGVSLSAVEPNDAMREQGQLYTAGTSIQWSKGSAEQTGLPTGSVDWVTMASSFHWATLETALTEFHRILKPGGYMTVLWNPRDVQRNPLHDEIEALLYRIVPDLSRVSSGAASHVRDYARELPSTGQFGDVVFFEAEHDVVMSRERYLGVWRSVNDVQRQAGPERFKQLLDGIEALIAPFEQITVPYKTRAWSARRIG